MRQPLLVVLVLAACAGAASAQITSGRLSGTVVDPQGAAVPGAVVTVVNEQIKRTFSITTTERGEWAIPSVPTASYRVTVTAAGFKTAVVPDVQVDAATPATVNVTLELGAVAETVEVAAGAEVLQTSTSTISSTLTGRQINELPFTTRNALELILFLPGTQTPGTPRTSSINGLPKSSMNVTIDGISIQDNYLKSSDGFFASIQPKTDSIEEVTVSTANPSADAAGEGAAQVKFVTRSGSNEYHGGILWQHRNTALNANYYFNNIDGLPRDRIVLNQFGGRLGGPILKDRLFFFFSHEEFHLPQTYGSALQTVLTPAARQGIFTYRDSAGQVRAMDLYAMAAASNAALPSNIRQFPTGPDPRVSRDLAEIDRLVANGGNLRDRIATNNDYNRYNFNFQTPGTNVRRFPTARLDANLTDKHHLEFVWNYQHYNTNPDAVNGVLPIYPGTGSVLGSPASGGIRRKTFSAVTAVRSTLSPRLTTEVRFGFGGAGTSLFSDEIVPSLFNRWGGYAPVFNYTTNPYTRRTQSRRHTPVWTGNANLTWSRDTHLLNFGGTFSHVTSWVQSTSTQVIPTITFSMAANDPANTGATSLFTPANFPDSTPAQRSDAAALYALLTGRVSSIGRSVALDEKTKTYGPFPSTDRNYQREFAFYFQDSWRVRPGFTFNYGLRWDVQLPFVAENDTYTRVGIEGLYGISGVGNLFRPGVLQGVEPQFFQARGGEGAFQTYWKHFNPSTGFAWTIPGTDHKPLKWLLGPHGRSVLRGGYSISTMREGMNVFTSIWGENQGRSVTLTINPGNFPAEFGPPGSVWFRDNALPARRIPDRPSYPIPVVAGDGVNDFDPNLRMGYVQSWTLSFQRELAQNTVLDFRYVGNHGVGLWRQSNLNEVNIFENGFLDEFKIAMNNLAIARASNPTSNNFGNQGLPGQRDIPIIRTALNLISDANFATTIERGAAGSLANSIAFDATRMNRLRAAGYPPNFFVVNPSVLGGGSFIVRNGGSSTYNALQVEVRRRLSAGLLLQGSYAWSKSLSNVIASSSVVFDQPTTFRSTSLDKAPSPWDIRHGLKLNWIYELPFGSNRRYLSNLRQPVLRRVFEGWEIAGVSRMQAGSPEYLRSGRQTYNSASGQDATADSGVILHNLTGKQLQDMMKVRKEPNRIVYVLPQALIDNSMAAFEVGGKTLRDLDRNAPYIGPPTTPGELGYRVFLYGPWQARWDLALLKKTSIGERKNIELRVQFLNAFNAANFLLGGAGNVVNTTVIDSSFGQTRAAYRDITVSGSNDPGGRLIEFVLRFNF